jgi:glycosyltransferase involved in cell wall biosynthesis
VRLLVVSNMYPSPETPHFGVFVKRQVEALRALGAEVDLAISTRGGGSPAAVLRKYGEILFTARRAARRARPDAIVAHFAFPTGAVGLLTARKSPVVVVAHGRDVDPGEHKPPGVRALTRVVLRRVALTVAVGAEAEREARALGARNTMVASMGYDEDSFFPRSRTEARARLGLSPTGRYAVFVGNLIERKGIGVLVEAARAAGDEVTWLVVGGGPERARWERDAPTSVRFAGPQLPGDVPWWLAAADVAVVPSLREPFGVAAVEALACGIPVVASDTGGLAALPGEAGVLVPPGDATALAKEVSALFTDDVRRADLASKAPATAAPHTARRQASLLLEAIEILVALSIARRQ